MNNKVFLFITLFFVVAAVFISQQRAPQTSREKSKLFPELANSINNISEITVTDSEKTLTIHRASDKWTMADADNYPALINKVKQTVVAVAELNVLAEKTADPKLYKRLGVEATDTKGATSHLLTLKSDDKTLASLIVGDTRRSQSPSGSAGVYVRLPGQEQALLVDGKLSVSTDMVTWIKRDVIDIASDRIRDIQIKRGDDAAIRLQRKTSADDLMLADLPEGKEQQAEYIINPMGALLENIYVEGVKNRSALDFTSPDAMITVKTFDGLSANVTVVQNEGVKYVAFSFSTSTASTANEEHADTDGDNTEHINPEKEAAQLNARASGWAYQLSESKMALFDKTLADLIRDPQQDKANGDIN